MDVKKSYRGRGIEGLTGSPYLALRRVTAGSETPDGDPTSVGVAGIFKLKQHVDNPGQAPMKDPQ